MTGTTIITSRQIATPVMGTTIAADGTKLDFPEIRRKHRVRPSQGIPFPNRPTRPKKA